MIAGKYLLFGALTFFTFQAQVSANDEVETDPLSNISISKDELIKSLDMLKKQGKISQDDYDKAKKELAGLSASDVDNIKEKAVGLVRHDPDKALKLYNAPKIDSSAIAKELEAANIK